MDFSTAAKPLTYPGTSGRGLLLIHGFTSTPGSLALWAEGLRNATKDTVEVPLLPGHGTVWSDLNQVSWKDWEGHLLQTYDRMSADFSSIAVGGLSLGGALAALVAARRPQTRALILVNHLMWLRNPALPLAPLIRRLTPSLDAVAGDIAQPGVVEPAYDRVPTGGVDEFRKLLQVVRPLLKGIHVPTRIFKSRQDHVVPRISATRTLKRLGSEQKDLIWLERSFHVAPLDYDLPDLIRLSAEFLSP